MAYAAWLSVLFGTKRPVASRMRAVPRDAATGPCVSHPDRSRCDAVGRVTRASEGRNRRRSAPLVASPRPGRRRARVVCCEKIVSWRARVQPICSVSITNTVTALNYTAPGARTASLYDEPLHVRGTRAHSHKSTTHTLTERTEYTGMCSEGIQNNQASRVLP